MVKLNCNNANRKQSKISRVDFSNNWEQKIAFVERLESYEFFVTPSLNEYLVSSGCNR
jgi:hypothetical protein